jgi:hypothetical protein
MPLPICSPGGFLLIVSYRPRGISISSVMSTSSATASGLFLIGGDLPVHRMGYGTMHLVGDGAWGEPADSAED